MARLLELTEEELRVFIMNTLGCSEVSSLNLKDIEVETRADLLSLMLRYFGCDTRNHARHLVRSGQVKLDGEPLSAFSLEVKGGETLSIGRKSFSLKLSNEAR